jgi:hypothetical protein
MDHLVKEAIEIQIQFDNCNRNMEFTLSHSFYLAINMHKKGRIIKKHCNKGPVTASMPECPGRQHGFWWLTAWFLSLLPQQTTLGLDITDHLTLPTFLSAGHAGTAKNMLCRYKCNVQQQHSSHQPLIIERGKSLWNIGYYLHPLHGRFPKKISSHMIIFTVIPTLETDGSATTALL